MVEIARIILFAKDMDAMLAFYEGILGLQRLETDDDSKDFVSLDAGGICLSLHKIPSRYAKNINITDPPVPRENTAMKVAFRVENIREFRETLLAQGVKMHKVFESPSLCFCDGTDPEGNIFQISNRP